MAAPLGATPQEASDPPARGSPDARIGGGPAPCVTVEVAEHRAGSVDCAAARLAAVARAAQARARNDPSLPVPNATSAPLVVGIGSVAASSQRLGANLRGATSLPQRPMPAPPPVNAFSRRP